MNENTKDSSFNDNFQILTQGKEIEKIQEIFINVIQNTTAPENFPPALRIGIQVSILKSILTLMDLDINPISKEILPEYNVLISEIKEVFESLNPEKESNWIEECVSYGDKKAYYWDWKHYGSKELY